MNIDLLLKNLSKRGFVATFFQTAEEANKYLLTLIPPSASVGLGGSMTLVEMGVPQLLGDNGRTVFYSGFSLTEEEKAVSFDKIHKADWFLSSTNALCMSGELVNIDGRANRIAEMVHGPQNIVIVTGVNKIVDTIEEGIYRSRNIAAPKNCERLKRKTPCAVTGKCHMCNSPDTICRATLIQHHPTFGKNVYIVIVNQNLGY
ncbi:MAG TPA: lactate utilization protein [Clostridia bacterium]|nr:lactate utilization protein [Clostridia bacterium]